MPLPIDKIEYRIIEWFYMNNNNDDDDDDLTMKNNYFLCINYGNS